jgi:hypothetical protein
MRDTLGHPLPTCERCGVLLDPRVLSTKPTAIAGADGNGVRVWCFACVIAAQRGAQTRLQKAS